MNWPKVHHLRSVVRGLAWFGIVAVVILSVVPASERPVTGKGQWFEHFAAFAHVGGTFAIGYRLALMRLLLLAFLFCGIIASSAAADAARQAKRFRYRLFWIMVCYWANLVW